MAGTDAVSGRDPHLPESRFEAGKALYGCFALEKGAVKARKLILAWAIR